MKPDISLAKKSGHLYLLTTSPVCRFAGNTPGTADRASQVLNERIIADALY
jgi:hypothetical protein